MTLLGVLLAITLALTSCGFVGNKAAPCPPAPEQTVSHPAESAAPAEGLTRVEMVNVNIRLDPELIVRIRRLSGNLVPAVKGKTPNFDDKLSYVMAVDSAEIAVDVASMTHMMNTYVFGEADAPLKNLRLSIENGQVKQEGTIRKGPGIHFETIGDMSPTPDGR